MKILRLCIILIIILLFFVACTKEAGFREGVFEGASATGDTLSIKIVKLKDGDYKIKNVSYNFVGGMKVDKTVLKSVVTGLGTFCPRSFLGDLLRFLGRLLWLGGC